MIFSLKIFSLSILIFNILLQVISTFFESCLFQIFSSSLAIINNNNMNINIYNMNIIWILFKSLAIFLKILINQRQNISSSCLNKYTFYYLLFALHVASHALVCYKLFRFDLIRQFVINWYIETYRGSLNFKSSLYLFTS